MGENTKIGWTATRMPDGTWRPGSTFSPWLGCTNVSSGCDNCYDEALARRTGLVKWGNHPRRRTSAAYWRQPLAWNRKAAASGQPWRVFCASMADVFDNQVDPAWRDDLWNLIADTPSLTWMLLTKRPENIPKMVPYAWLAYGRSYQNVWLGCTVENQAEAERRIPHLLNVPARVRFLSCEPLLGPIDLRSLQYESGNRLPEAMRVNDGRCSIDVMRGVSIWPGSHYISPLIKTRCLISGGYIFESHGERRAIDWLICGGESGPGARPMKPEWARSLQQQCSAAGVPFFFKQWGEWAPSAGSLLPQVDSAFDRPMIRVGKKRAGALLDGREWREFPNA